MLVSLAETVLLNLRTLSTLSHLSLASFIFWYHDFFIDEDIDGAREEFLSGDEAVTQIPLVEEFLLAFGYIEENWFLGIFMIFYKVSI